MGISLSGSAAQYGFDTIALRHNRAAAPGPWHSEVSWASANPPEWSYSGSPDGAVLSNRLTVVFAFTQSPLTVLTRCQPLHAYWDLAIGSQSSLRLMPSFFI